MKNYIEKKTESVKIKIVTEMSELEYGIKCICDSNGWRFRNNNKKYN
jgi:hypothetical protein